MLRSSIFVSQYTAEPENQTARRCPGRTLIAPPHRPATSRSLPRCAAGSPFVQRGLGFSPSGLGLWKRAKKSRTSWTDSCHGGALRESAGHAALLRRRPRSGARVRKPPGQQPPRKKHGCKTLSVNRFSVSGMRPEKRASWQQSGPQTSSRTWATLTASTRMCATAWAKPTPTSAPTARYHRIQSSPQP